VQAPVAGGRAKRIPEVYQWTPDMLMAHMAMDGKRLGLVIDLTCTDKYYSPEMAFKRAHVAHEKLESRGHGEVPSALVVNQFYWTVRTYTLHFQQLWQAVRSGSRCRLQQSSLSLY
jgi:hypothetical protein